VEYGVNPPLRKRAEKFPQTGPEKAQNV